MSCYRNIYQDFPSRCAEVWKHFEEAQNNGNNDLSVTSMLMVAAAGFSSPWEHLKDNNPSKNAREHPAFKGISQEDYKATLARLTSNFSTKLTESTLFGRRHQCLWDLRDVKELAQVRDAGEYSQGTEICATDKNERFLLKILRNALAHSNICAFGRKKEIERLSFFSEDTEYVNGNKQVIGWHVATTTVDGFRSFLKNWFKLIEGPRLWLVLQDALETEDLRSAA